MRTTGIKTSAAKNLAGERRQLPLAKAMAECAARKERRTWPYIDDGRNLVTCTDISFV
jgi:hypothetical protein